MHRLLILPGLLLALLAVWASPAPGAQPLDTTLSVRLHDVPLADALAVIARRLDLALDVDSLPSPPPRVTFRLDEARAEVLFELLAWQTGLDWSLLDGTLRWAPRENLSGAEFARARQERADRLDRQARILDQRLSRPLPFRLRAHRVKLESLLLFLEEKLDTPFFLDARCSDDLTALVAGEFGGGSAVELLTQLLSGSEGRGPLRWTLVDQVVVVSRPTDLRALKAPGR